MTTRRINFHCKYHLSDMIDQEADRTGKSLTWVLNRCIAEFFKDKDETCKGYAVVLDTELEKSGNNELS